MARTQEEPYLVPVVEVGVNAVRRAGVPVHEMWNGEPGVLLSDARKVRRLSQERSAKLAEQSKARFREQRETFKATPTAELITPATEFEKRQAQKQAAREAAARGGVAVR